MTRRTATDIDLNLLARDGIPVQFSWNGRRYLVQRVLMHWVEIGPWWQALRLDFSLTDDLDATWRIWRVEAQGSGSTLICDLAYRDCLTSASAYPWRMIRVFD